MRRGGLCLFFVVSLVAGCAPRSGPPAPVELHGNAAGVAAAAGQAPLPHPDRVTVANGETLYGIARRYGLPTRAIIDANNLQPPYRLDAGTSLVLPQVRTHPVKAGDTLNSVSRTYGVDLSTLAATNHLQPPYVIRTGETLVLPASVETARATMPTPVAGQPPDEPIWRAPLQPAAAAASPAPPMPAPAGSAPSPPTTVASATTALQPTALAPPKPLTLPPSNDVPPAPDGVPAPQTALLPPKTLNDSPPSLPAPVPGKGFLWPVRGRVIAGFGTSAQGTHNDGINIAAPLGTPVLAADAGEIAYAGNELKGYGNLILVKHANGYITAYAHNDSLLVKRGDHVARGQAIARVGATGAVSEPQLHFELRRGARVLDPTDYLPSSAATASR